MKKTFLLPLKIEFLMSNGPLGTIKEELMTRKNHVTEQIKHIKRMEVKILTLNKMMCVCARVCLT